jgi:hypothetical protein
MLLNTRISRSRLVRLVAVSFMALATSVLLGVLAAPALAAAPEAPETKAATLVTATTATLNGVLDPLSTTKVGYDFTYNTNGTCEPGLTSTPGTESTEEAREVSTPVTELEGSTEYTFCVVAINEDAEATSGAPLTFKTSASKPVIPTGGGSTPTLTPFDASLQAVVNPETRVTVYHFEYATSEAKLLADEGTSIGESSIPAASEPQTAGPVDIGGGLEPAHTYYYRVIAANVTGTTVGPAEHFTTPPLEAPLIDGENVTGITQTNAVLHALINPNYQETTYQFQIGTSTAYSEGPVLLSEGALGGAGFFGDLEASVNLAPQEGVISEEITLQPNTEYHYEALATNATATTEGLTSTPGDQVFLTLPNPPAVTTGPPGTVTANTAALTGTVNPGASGHPEEDETTYFYEYGGTTSYGNRTPTIQAGQGETPVPAPAALGALEPGRTYHYRIVASNLNNASGLSTAEYGEHIAPQTVYGEDETFTTPATPPAITDLMIQNITQSTAVITATLEPNNLPTRYELQLGTTQGQLQPAASGQANTTTPITIETSALTPGTRYYYKLTATNPSNTTNPTTIEGTFTTAAPPPAPALATLPPEIPFTPISQLDAKETQENKTITSHHLTNQQKLTKALKACRKTKNKHKRQTCEKQAHHKYPTKHTTHK